MCVCVCVCVCVCPLKVGNDFISYLNKLYFFILSEDFIENRSFNVFS